MGAPRSHHPDGAAALPAQAPGSLSRVHQAATASQDRPEALQPPPPVQGRKDASGRCPLGATRSWCPHTHRSCLTEGLPHS